MQNEIWITKRYVPINDELLVKVQKTLAHNLNAYYILPSSRLIREAQNQYFNLGGDITFKGGIVSLNALIQTMLNSAGINNRIIDKATSVALVAKILLKLLAENRLKYFSHFSGIEDMAPDVLSILKEIKHYYNSHEKELNELLQLPLKYHDIMLIYDEYYNYLEMNNLLDIELAITRVVRLCNENLKCLQGELLVVAGLSLNKLHLDLIEALKKRFSKVIILMQANYNQDIFTREFNLISYLHEKGFAQKDIESANSLGSSIFTESKPINQVIQVQGYHAKRQEVKEVVKQIKGLLCKGVAANNIAVVAKNPNEYNQLFRYFTDKASIPFHSLGSNSILQTMPVKMVLQLVKVASFNWSADEFLNFLTEDYLWPSTINATLIADFIRITPSTGPLYNWISTCSRYKLLNNVSQLNISETSLLTAEQLDKVEEGLLHLKQLWSALPKKGSYQDWCNALIKLVKILGVEESVNNFITSTNRIEANRLYRAWSILVRTLKFQSQFTNLWPNDMNLKTFFVVIKSVLKQQLINDEAGSGDNVQLYSPLQAQGLNTDHLFIVGFNEGTWPTGGKGTWLHNISNDDIKLPLQAIKDYQTSEKLSFTRVIDISKNIKISYCKFDNQEKELLPSQYLVDLINSCGVNISDKSPSLIAESLKEACSTDDYYAIAVYRQGLASDEHINNRVGTEILRFNDEASAYNGLISDNFILKKLNQYFGNNAVYSTTMLEQYGKCPWAFYMQRVLKIKPLDQLAIDVNPLIKGNIIHSVLASFLSQHRENVLQNSLINEYEERLTELLAKEISKIKSQLTDEGETWVNIESDRILFILRLWLQNEIALQNNSAFRPTDFEYNFNQQNSLSITDDVFTLMIEGFIDRIDISEDSVLVYDYKSGVAPRLQDIKDGVAFQIPFYSMAAQKKYPSKTPIGGGYYRIGGDYNRKSGMWHEDHLTKVDLSNRIGDKVKAEEWNTILKKVQDTALLYQREIVDGNFRLSPRRPCPLYCPYKNICRMTPLLRAIVEAKYNEVH